MRPFQIAKESESSHQQAFFAYCAFAANQGFARADLWASGADLLNTPGIPERKLLTMLDWIHHIPNGGSRGSTAKDRAIRGGKLKAEGVRKGVLDVFLPYPVYIQKPSCSFWVCGLYIEFKKPSEKPKREGSKGGLSDEQISFKNYVEAVGYKCEVCYSYLEAIEALKRYLGYV